MKLAVKAGRVQWKDVNFKQVFEFLESENIPLTFVAISKTHDGKVKAAFKKLFGVEVKGRTFLRTLVRFYENLEDALEKNGFAQKPKNTERDQLLEVVRQLLLRHIRLDAYWLRTRDPQSMQLIKEYTGLDLTPAEFFGLVIRKVDQWPRVIEATRMPVAKVEITAWLDDTLLEAVALINSYSAGDDIESKLKWHFGLDLAVAEIQRAVRGRFQTWTNASSLVAPDQIKPRGIKWTPEVFERVVKFLARHFPTLSHDELIIDDERMRVLTFAEYGRAVSYAGLRSAVLALKYPSWLEALETVGIEQIELTRQIAPRMKWSPPLMLNVISFLAKHFDDMSVRNLISNAKLIEQLTLDHFKRGVSIESLIQVSTREFGTWLRALEKAEIPQIEAMRRKAKMEWSRSSIIEVLRYLSKYFKDMNLFRLVRQTDRIKKLTFEKFGREIGPVALYEAVSLEFRPSTADNGFKRWISGLAAAGISKAGYLDPYPKTVVPKKRATSNITIMPHVEYWTMEANGRARKVIEYGQPPVNPEEAHIANFENNLILSAVESLSANEKRISEALLDYLSEDGDMEDRDAVVEFVSSQINANVAWNDVSQIMETLAANISSVIEPKALQP